MSDSKGANKLFLVIVTLFVAAGFLINRIFPMEVPVYVSALLGQLVIVLPALFYCWKRKIAVKELIPYRKISFSTGILVVVTTLLMYPLMVVLNAITLLFTNSATAAMQAQMADFNIVIATLIIAVVPACVEEFVFRGVLFQTYRKKRVFTAILLSAFLFGCMHMNLNQFVYAFALGIYMAFLVEGTGSIISSMIAHFTVNFIGVALSAIVEAASGGQEVSQNIGQTGNLLQDDAGYVFVLLVVILIWFVIAVGTTIGAIAIYIQICKRNHKWEHMKTICQRKNEETMITIPLILGIIITVVMIILSF